ncbi:MAG: hypothetical protein HZB91_11930 [Elusimicrobia bacterium]|nr:hypothetical protein [Elusimicrobiota bacterium]
MTRPSSLWLAVALLLPLSLSWSQAPAGQEKPLQALGSSFQSHQKDQPFLDQIAEKAQALVCPGSASAAGACADFKSALLKARDIQEGCAEPCDSASEVELYRAKISLVCEDLGLDTTGCGKAWDNYIPSGVPRKKPAGGASLEQAKFEAQAITALLSDPSIDPKLRTELNDKALQLAEALGRLKWTDGDGSSVVAAMSPLARLDLALKGGQAAVLPTGAKTGPVPIPVKEIESRFAANLKAQASRFPTGAAVLKAAEPLPPISFENIKDENGNTTLAYYDNNKQKMVFNSQRVAEFIRGLDPATAKQGLEEVPALKEYLSRNPEALAKLSAHFDVLYVHEMTHRGQHLKAGVGLIDNTINGWKRILSGNKYPIEHEWEAFGNQNKYFAERAKKEPEIFNYRDSPEFGIMEHEEYVNDLQAYRRSKASLYQDECDTADKLRFFKKDKPAYDAVLGRQAKEWPRVSYDGNMGLARHWASFKSPENSFGYLAKALDRASDGRFLAEVKPEMAAFFDSAVKKLEALLAENKPGAPPRELRGPSAEAIRKLSTALGVPLPPKVAAALAPKPPAKAPSKKP